MKKRAVATLVCLIMIAVACFMALDFDKVKAGKGVGKSASIETLDEVGELLAYVDAPSQNFESATIELNIVSSMLSRATLRNTYGSGHGGGLNEEEYPQYSESTVKDGKLTLCYTKNSKYYHFLGKLDEVTELDIEIYIDLKGTFIRFNSLSGDMSSSFGEIGEALFNKWIVLPSYSQVFSSYVSQVKAVLNQMRSLGNLMVIGELDFRKSMGKYSLDEDNAIEFYKKSFGRLVNVNRLKDSDFRKAKCTLDIKNDNQILGEMQCVTKMELKDQISDYKVYETVFFFMEDSNFVIKNVNNTKIEFDYDDAHTFEDLFGEEEEE
ncbi:MAG: hypothetical protein IJA97_02375 [Clostridia bacterium]|nr:hypothetical protein [Clostridia bacterium]